MSLALGWFAAIEETYPTPFNNEWSLCAAARNGSLCSLLWETSLEAATGTPDRPQVKGLRVRRCSP